MIIATFGMKIGRKNWILIGNVIEIVGSIISATSYSYGQLGKYNHVLDDLVADNCLQVAGRVFIVSLTRINGVKLIAN